MDVAATLLSVLDKHGVFVFVSAVLTVVVGFLIHRSMQREDKLQKQLNELNKEVREAVVPVMVQCTAALKGCQDVIAQNSRVIERLIGGSNQ